MECTQGSENVRMLLHCWPFSCLLRTTLFVNCARVCVFYCACEHVGEECFAYSCCERGRVGRPVAARRISRSCVVAAGLVARGDTRTEEGEGCEGGRGVFGSSWKGFGIGG